MIKTEGIKILGKKITCLFYADDGLILANDKEKAERSRKMMICGKRFYMPRGDSTSKEKRVSNTKE